MQHRKTNIRNGLLLFISFSLAFSSSVQSDTPCGLGVNDPWIASIYVDNEGWPNMWDSEAYDMKQDDIWGEEDCFIEIVLVYNDGDYRCWDHSGDIKDSDSYSSAECGRVDGIGYADVSASWSGRYTLLGDPINYIDYDTKDMAEHHGELVVVSGDYITIGVNEEAYVTDTYSQRQTREPEFASILTYKVYSLIKLQDSLGIYTTEEGEICKNERLYPIDYEIEGINADNAWDLNIENGRFGVCRWLLIDYDKHMTWPGIYYVVLNKSKFGFKFGLGYYAVVGQDERNIEHIYPESITPGEFYDPSSSVCCTYTVYRAGFIRCLTSEECEACSPPKEACTIVNPVSCSNSAPQYCGYDPAIGRSTQVVNYSIAMWNFEAGTRLLGCDTCERGDRFCSMGSSVANARLWECNPPGWGVFDPGTPGCNYDDYPFSPEQRCGHYFIPERYVPAWITGPTVWDEETCDCLTGRDTDDDMWDPDSCSERQCAECAKMGWKTYWKGGDWPYNGKCIGQPYTLGPTAKPDHEIVAESIMSIRTNITAYFVTYTHWWFNACGHNVGGFDDGTPGSGWSLRGDGYACRDPTGTALIGCTLFDCKVPWGPYAASGPMWDYNNRGGGAAFVYYIAQGQLNYTHYPTNVPANNCSDFIEQIGNGVLYWQDRYTRCGDTTDGETCDCTRPEHIPKDHTPCPCPSGAADCCIEYVDSIGAHKPDFFGVLPGSGTMDCAAVADPRCFMYGETPAPKPPFSADPVVCLCEVTEGSCPDTYCTEERFELPRTCPQDCNPCGSGLDTSCCYPGGPSNDFCPCDEDLFCDDDEHYSWCDDCRILNYDEPFQCKDSLYDKMPGVWNRCMCGDGVCWPLGGEDWENCSNDCSIPSSVRGDGVCWAPPPANEHWSEWSFCYHDSWQGGWDDYCGKSFVDCPLPRAHDGSVCEYWDGEWSNWAQCPRPMGETGLCDIAPGSICCIADGICRTDHEDETCSDCQSPTPGVTCNHDCFCDPNENLLCWAPLDPSRPANCTAAPGDAEYNPYDTCSGSRCDNDGWCEPATLGEVAGCDNCGTTPQCWDENGQGLCLPAWGEDVANCEVDCPIPLSNSPPCDDDGVCFWKAWPPYYGETNTTCGPDDYYDCPYPPGQCGDGVCWTDTPAYTGRCSIDEGGPGVETIECCPEDCSSKHGECGDSVCWPDLGDTYVDCMECPPPVGIVGDGVCEWWRNGDPESEPTDNCGVDASDESSVCEPINPDDPLSPPKCCICPDEERFIDYDMSYYRQFTRDSVWSHLFKITPEVSNVSIEWCTDEIDCDDSFSNVNDMISLATGDVFLDLDEISYEARCGEMAGNAVCGGCYWDDDDTDCRDCNVTGCGQYEHPLTCVMNPCKVAEEFYPPGEKFSGCYINSTNDCHSCTGLKGLRDPCNAYPYLEMCEIDSCSIGECGWSHNGGVCVSRESNQRRCSNVCSGPTCTYTACKSADKIAIKKGCSFADILAPFAEADMGCQDCDDITLCGMYANETACKDDSCDVGCYWRDDSCNNCNIIRNMEGCSAYTSIEVCIDDPCVLEWGCAWGANDTCVGCNHVTRCEDYSKYYELDVDIGTACISDPCGVGPCGLVDYTAPGVEEFNCTRSTQASCREACPAELTVGTAICAREDCQHARNARVTDGGCYWMFDAPGVGNNCASCNGDDEDDRSTAVVGCGGYIRVESCMEDWCGVGPCYWNDDDICKRALTVNTNESAWVRTGEVGYGEQLSAGGGSYWVHAAGGADVPNWSEAVGDWRTLDPNACTLRNGSIWSEVKNYMTYEMAICLMNTGQTSLILDHLGISDSFPGIYSVAACDSRTVGCNAWIRPVDEGDSTVRRVEPVGQWPGGEGHGAHIRALGVDDPPYVCGTLCGKYVRSNYGSDPYFVGPPYWPAAYAYLNPWMNSSFNLTVSETDVDGDTQVTIADIYFRSASLGRAYPHYDGRSPNPTRGNILPAPGHPYTIFNWFNMPPSMEDVTYRLNDSTNEVMLQGNYTVNMSLFRDARAMQCLWDGCLPHAIRRWRDISPVPCALAGQDPGCGLPYYNEWERCHNWQCWVDIVTGCWCACAEVDDEDDGWHTEYRCIYCWMLQSCDYPVEMEEINDTSSVLTNVYGEELAVSRALTSDDPHVNFVVKGYVDLKEPGRINGSIIVKAEPDILNSINLLVPKRFRLEFIAKDYPVEHELFRTELTKTSDECGQSDGTSKLYCARENGDWAGVACNEYDPYDLYRKDMGGDEYQPQRVSCLDQWTKEILGRFAGLTEPEEAHFYIVENFRKKFYHYLDTYGATDKHYTWDIGVYGIDGAWFWVDKYWYDIGKTIGTFRNFHEDEAYYYDLVRLYPEPRSIGGWVESELLQKNISSVNPIQLDPYVSMNGDVMYDPDTNEYKFDFWSNSIDIDDFRDEAELVLHEAYRGIAIKLVGTGSPFPSISRDITVRNPVTLDLTASCVGDCDFGSQPQAYRDVSVVVLASGPSDPYDVIKVQFLPPYEGNSRWIHSGDPITFLLKDSSVTIIATYEGYWSGDPFGDNFEYESQMLNVPVLYKGTLSWVLRHIWLMILGFFAIVTYRWFKDHRMDVEKMIKESGMYELLQDFLGLK